MGASLQLGHRAFPGHRFQSTRDESYATSTLHSTCTSDDSYISVTFNHSRQQTRHTTFRYTHKRPRSRAVPTHEIRLSFSLVPGRKKGKKEGDIYKITASSHLSAKRRPSSLTLHREGDPHIPTTWPISNLASKTTRLRPKSARQLISNKESHHTLRTRARGSCSADTASPRP